MDSNTVTAVTPLLAPVRSEVNRAQNTADEVAENQGKVTRRLGSILLDMERMDASMKVIRKEIQKDIRTRQRELNRESKIIQKDQKNLELLKTSFFGIREFVGKVAFVSAIGNLLRGDFGNATVDAGTAALAYLPEIAGGVASILGIKAIAGSRGGRTPQGGVRPAGGLPGRGKMGRGRAGGIMALLALGAMALGGMSGGQQSGDQKRGQLLQQEVASGNIINRDDVERFGSISRRFSRALDRFVGLTLGEDKEDESSKESDEDKDGDKDKGRDPYQDPGGTRVTDDADQSKAFPSGMVTGPEANIGMTPTADGRNSYHVDTKFNKDLPMEDVVNMMDQLARGYEEQGRTMEFSNTAVADRRYSTDMTYAEKVKLMEDAFAAHSHSSSGQFNSIDYYINKENETRSGQSAENAEILLPTLGGSSIRYGESPGYGAFANTVDANGKILTKTGHGDDKKFEMPLGGLVIDIDPTEIQDPLTQDTPSINPASSETPRSQQIDPLPENYQPAKIETSQNLEPPKEESGDQASLPLDLPNIGGGQESTPAPQPIAGASPPPSNTDVRVEAIAFSGTGNAIANLSLLSNYNSPSLIAT